MKTEDTRERITLLTKKDLEVSYFVGSGAGGQNKQKNATGVLIQHPESGAFGRASDTRSREQNKGLAFQRLHNHPKMKVWLSGKIYEMRMGESLEDRVNRQVDKMMSDSNLRIEVQENGVWKQVDNAS